MSKTIIEFDNETGFGTHTAIRADGEKTVRRMFITTNGEVFDCWERVDAAGIVRRSHTGESTLSITAKLRDRCNG